MGSVEQGKKRKKENRELIKPAKREKRERPYKFCRKCWIASSTDASQRTYMLSYIIVQGVRHYLNGHSAVDKTQGLLKGDIVQCSNPEALRLSDMQVKAEEKEARKLDERKGNKRMRSNIVSIAIEVHMATCPAG